MNATSSTSFSSEFADFLFAPIGQDKNGMSLSVLSALARQDVDPWEEAAKLTQLPEEEAVSHLVSLLGVLPRATLAGADRVTTATRLLALLPGRRGHVRPAVKPFAQADPVEHVAVVSDLLFALIILILVLVSAWLIGNFQEPGQVEGRSTPSPSAFSQPSPPSNE
jgi:hypothetical protein